MLALWERSPRTVRDIGEALSLEPATLSPLLKRLEGSGLITRKRKSGDERSLDVELTAGGRDLRAEAEKVPAQIVARLGMPIAELEATRDALTRLLAAANATSTSEVVVGIG
jgi:DNA-binding MarR family transcriptional regulator